MQEHFERPLSTRERDVLERRLAQGRRRARLSFTKAGAASIAVCGVLSALTLVASDAPAIVVGAFWATVATALAVWIGFPERRTATQQAAALAAGLSAGRVRGVRIRSARVVEFEELEDEGACYAFDVGSGRVTFIHGQEFYASAAFPNSDFSLVEVLATDGSVVDHVMHTDGVALVPERKIASETKARLALPDHLETVSAGLDRLEHELARDRA